MQIIRAEVIPVEWKLNHPVQISGIPLIQAVTAIYVRLETPQGQTAWGCTVVQSELNGVKPRDALGECHECVGMVMDLNAGNLEYVLDELAARVNPSLLVFCAFDLAFHDLLALMAGMPLYRILGGYRDRIQTFVTIPIARGWGLQRRMRS